MYTKEWLHKNKVKKYQKDIKDSKNQCKNRNTSKQILHYNNTQASNGATGMCQKLASLIDSHTSSCIYL